MHLVPEMLGLAVTPAAVIACLLLLGSSHPARNVSALASVFFAAYAAFAAAVLVAGHAAEADGASQAMVRGWASLTVGVLFLAGAVYSHWHARRRPAAALLAKVEAKQSGDGASRGSRPAPGSPDPPTDRDAPAGTDGTDGTDEPAWAGMLRDPPLKLVATAGLLIAVLNPNVAILVSGLGIVLTAEVPTSQQAFGVAFLLAASMVDFAVPVLIFVMAGKAGRAWLQTVTAWLLAHNHVIGIVVLAAFGTLFTVRGIEQLLG